MDDAGTTLSPRWMTDRETELSRYPSAHNCAVESEAPQWLPAEAMQSGGECRAASAHAAALASAAAVAAAKVVAAARDRGTSQAMALPPEFSATTGEALAPARQTLKNAVKKKESYTSFSPAEDSSVHFNIGYRELPLTAAGSQSFLAVLQSKPVGACTQELSAAQIKSVSNAMGVWPPVGHIQSAQLSGQSAFDLRSAAIKSLNGENYLYVEGTYKNNGVPTTYMVAFMDGGQDPVSETERVEEVQLQGPSQTIFAYRAAFQNMLSTIRRKNSTLSTLSTDGGQI